MQKERSVALGVLVGLVAAALGVTSVAREAWIGVMTPPSRLVPGPITLFSAYLIQAAGLAGVTFHAYRRDRHGITAAAWILTTWESVAMITRSNLLDIKLTYPSLYQLTALLHIVAVVSLFLAMAARAYRLRDRDRRLAQIGAQERSVRQARLRERYGKGQDHR